MQDGEHFVEQMNIQDRNRVDERKRAAEKRSRMARRNRNKLLKEKDKAIKMLKMKVNEYKKRLHRSKQNGNKLLSTHNTKIKQLVSNPTPEAKQQVIRNLLFGSNETTIKRKLLITYFVERKRCVYQSCNWEIS